MTRTVPVIFGVIVVLFFSLWPIRLANSICCLGVVLGGLLGAALVGRADDGLLDSAVAMRVGAYVGVVSAIVVLLFNLVFWESAPDNVTPMLDPIPQYMYSASLGMAYGLKDLASETTTAIEPGGPGLIGRFIFQLISNALFGGFGGAIAASLFREESGVSHDQPAP